MVDVGVTFDMMEIRNAGYTAAECREAGWKTTELASAGFTVSELQEAGLICGPIQSSVADPTVTMIKIAGLNAHDQAAGQAGIKNGDIVYVTCVGFSKYFRHFDSETKQYREQKENSFELRRFAPCMYMVRSSLSHQNIVHDALP